MGVAALLAGCSESSEGNRPGGQAASPMSADSLRALAREACIYAFATVEHNKSLGGVLSVGANMLLPRTTMIAPAETSTVAPNNDTYYSTAVLDLRAEPVVISVPAVADRYFAFQLVDMFTDNLEYISPSSTGRDGGNYLIAHSDWKGTVPPGIAKQIASPAMFVFTVARTQAYEAIDKTALDIQSRYAVVPLSAFAKTPPPPAPGAFRLPARVDAKSCSAEEFFGMFNLLIQYQRLAPRDVKTIGRFEALGVHPGKEYDRSVFDDGQWRAIEDGVAEGRAAILVQTTRIGTSRNGWDFSPANAGKWGDDYLTRAAAAWKYIYVNSPAEAVYPTANVDAEGAPLDGSKGNYVLAFSKDQVPRVRYFWSLTMYSDRGYLYANPVERYLLNSSQDLRRGTDGSLTLYLQHENPEEAESSNWLPAPRGPFFVILRMYGPEAGTLSGADVLPPLVRMP